MGASPVLFFRAPRARPEGGGLGPAAKVSGSAGRPVAAPSLIYMYDPDATCTTTCIHAPSAHVVGGIPIAASVPSDDR